MQRSCFCQLEYIRPGLVQVRSDAITAVTDAETLQPLDPQFFLTVDGLFDELQRAIDLPAFDIQAQFDSTLGYPTNFGIDFIQGVADDEIFYTARDLHILAAGDFDGDGMLTASDIDTLTAVIIEVEGGCDSCGEARFDLNQDGKVDRGDHREWVKDLKRTWFGDANLDGEFNSRDMVQVFAAGNYETGENTGWANGDWSGDLLFDSSDMVTAFTDGGYEKGPLTDTVAVPEPSSILMVIASLMGVAIRRHRRGR
jgi:hypothetical protein